MQWAACAGCWAFPERLLPGGSADVPASAWTDAHGQIAAIHRRRATRTAHRTSTPSWPTITHPARSPDAPERHQRRHAAQVRGDHAERSAGGKAYRSGGAAVLADAPDRLWVAEATSRPGRDGCTWRWAGCTRARSWAGRWTQHAHRADPGRPADGGDPAPAARGHSPAAVRQACQEAGIMPSMGSEAMPTTMRWRKASLPAGARGAQSASLQEKPKPRWPCSSGSKAGTTASSALRLGLPLASQLRAFPREKEPPPSAARIQAKKADSHPPPSPTALPSIAFVAAFAAARLPELLRPARPWQLLPQPFQ